MAKPNSPSRRTNTPARARSVGTGGRDRRPETDPARSASLQAGIWLKAAAEAFGTFVLVLAGCGSAVLASSFRNDGLQLGIGFLGVSLAFGLAVLAMAVAVGSVSGAQLNPAVTVGLACAGRMPWRDVPAHIVAQLVGAAVGAAALFAIASGRRGFDATASGFASNGYGDRSPGGFGLGSVALTEILLTAIFLAVIIAATGPEAPKALAPVTIGLTLTLTNLIAIPVDNASINPARSFGVALFAGPPALGQLWLFLVAPVVGAAIAGVVFRTVSGLRTSSEGQAAPRTTR